MEELFTKYAYLAPIDYILSSIITEYDIAKANISVLRKKGIIDTATYNRLYAADRMTRQITIGNMEKDQNIANALKEGIIEAKRDLFLANNIQDDEVLSIKNDAVYIIGRQLQYTEFDGGIKFAAKSVFTSYYRILKKEYYYYMNSSTQEENFDVKGMSTDVLLKVHDGYFLEFLKALFYSAQNDSIEDVLFILNGFYDNYVNKRLPIEYYRRFDGESRYDLIAHTVFGNQSYRADFIPESQMQYIDIQYNLRILHELQKIYSSIYFKRHGKG